MIGKTIAHYEILEKLGAGGMGVVYKAIDTKLNREVALKFLPFQISGNPEIRQRFIIEAQAAAGLNHPNITTIHATEEVENEMFIVMEFIEGEELSKKIDSHTLGVEESLDIAIQIAEGLNEAHKKGIVHRDIKSANVMITHDGRAKIMDFGLAKLTGHDAITQMGTTVGTINYMSPEQTRGEEIDQRTDIWSLGVVIYEMLTGHFPFKGNYEQAIIYSILNEKPSPVSTLIEEEIPEEIDRVLDRTLTKLPGERYADVSLMLYDLKAIKKSIETGVPVDPLETGYGSKGITHTYSATVKSKWKNVTIPVLISIFAILLILYSNSEPLLNFIGIGADIEGKHVAVLSFSNIGNDPVNQAFTDGLVETLTSKLSQLEQFDGQLWVVPASEIRKGKIESVSEAHNLYNVNFVLTGSVQVLIEGYRIIINLVDAATTRQLDSRMIDNHLASISFSQDEAVIKVAEMLNLELHPVSRELIAAGETVNPEAYELYLKGRGKLHHYDKQENISAAIDYFNQAVLNDTLYALAYAGLGESYWRYYKETKNIDMINNAIYYCNKAAELNKSITEVRIILGLIYKETGKYLEANEEFQKVLQVDPVNANAYRGRASTFLAMGMPNEAEASYKKAIEMKPDSWIGYSYLGAFYTGRRKFREAAAQFQKVIVLAPQNAKGYRNLGAVNYYLGMTESAIEMWNKSLELAPDYKTYSNLAAIYFKLGEYTEAARRYEEVIKMQQGDYEMWGYLAASYYWAPDERNKSNEANNKAANLAEEQLKINPNNMSVLCSLASYYGMLGEIFKVEDLLERIIELDPNDAYTLFAVGDIYEEWLDDRENALMWIGRAVREGYSLKELMRHPGLKNLLADERFEKYIGTRDSE